MTLRSKLLGVNVSLLAGVLLLAGASLWGLLQQRGHVRASLAEYEALKMVEAAEVKLISAKARLRETPLDRAAVLAELTDAREQMWKYKALLSAYDSFLPGEIPAGEKTEAKQRTKATEAKLSALLNQFNASAGSGADLAATPDLPALAVQADAVTTELAGLMRLCSGFLNKTGMKSDQDLRRAIIAVTALAAAIPLGSLLASLWQYRRIMVPLERLRRWFRRIAAGDFTEKYQPTTGDREFVELGNDVNRMAAELGAFYRELEQMVAAKSKELVRSERLASVGYLAAGVAHEINNPLNIMSGYAELSVKRLRRSTDPEVVNEVLKSLVIVREEAFRCKQITSKLLSLVKGGGEGRELVSMTHVASDVAVMVRGVSNFRGRKLDVAIDPDDPLTVLASAAEMKQVMLNLLVNALEAVPAGTGEVRVDGHRNSGHVELTVTDNGRGMTRAVLDRIFEPFYTEKRGAGEPGTGLGLSITHAIVADHGGEIRAESDGPGRGSRFVIRLPAHDALAAAMASQATVDGLNTAAAALQEHGK
jgi:two-component system, NtrC family, sensor kinase